MKKLTHKNVAQMVEFIDDDEVARARAPTIARAHPTAHAHAPCASCARLPAITMRRCLLHARQEGLIYIVMELVPGGATMDYSPEKRRFEAASFEATQSPKQAEPRAKAAKVRSLFGCAFPALVRCAKRIASRFAPPVTEPPHPECMSNVHGVTSCLRVSQLHGGRTTRCRMHGV